MLDVFIDMMNTTSARMASIDGGRCAAGSIAWELGIPHDRLKGRGRLRGLSAKDIKTCTDVLPKIMEYEVDIATTHDMMISHCRFEEIEKAIEKANKLISLGKEIGVNFIIASPIRKGKSNALPKQDAKELVSGKC